MCACSYGFTCSGCKGNYRRDDHEHDFGIEPKTVHDMRDRDKSEYTDLVVAPAVRASSVRQTR